MIDLAEVHSAGVAAFSYEGVKDARQRAAALLVVLLGGGAGLGGLGLTQWAISKPVALAALLSAVYWFCIAAYLAWEALRSATVRSWHTQGLVEMLPKWDVYARELTDEGTPTNGLNELRMSTVRNMETAADEYRKASTAAMSAIDNSYLLMSLTPLVSFAAVILV
ncbi:hypothetical protein F3K02_04135 [Hydrogenophaga sp. D2P1]|uniref:Uncharacterized protein n=1 Tax=Hydrogenophaga aromaticivorans TaxID=2610898 RepID=A0A7Y8KVU7_9BURK|nr:hypothetical protein [Hydrogenophaga aromaticivorans]NWF44444.1 hypothetical protein [Hydrogenophaga aromaticivorans]